MRRLLVLVGVLWFAANVFAAYLSVEDDVPYDLSFLDEPGKVDRIGDDWLYGWGTGLAMPLWFLAIGAVLTVVVSFGGGATRVSALLLAVVGAASLAFTFANQPANDLLHDPGLDELQAGTVYAIVVLDGFMILLGLLVMATTPRWHRS